jgi:hypothetical protein
MNRPYPRKHAAEPLVAFCTRVSPAADALRRRIERNMDWTARQVAEEALRALDRELETTAVERFEDAEAVRT